MKYILVMATLAVLLGLPKSLTPVKAWDPLKVDPLSNKSCCVVPQLRSEPILFMRLGKQEFVKLKRYPPYWALYPGVEVKEMPREIVASWYGPGFHGKTTCRGKRYNMYRISAAHREFPLGTVLYLRNPKSHKELGIPINDCGPYIEGRDIDLSLGAARNLRLVREGVVNLIVEDIFFPKPKKRGSS